jgi:DNA-binding response OmpR family regulator
MGGRIRRRDSEATPVPTGLRFQVAVGLFNWLLGLAKIAAPFEFTLQPFSTNILRAYSQAMRILIIEDERRLADNIGRSMREGAGYAVDLAFDGEEGLYMAESNPYDLVLLDLMLPRIDGKTVLERMRTAGITTPVLVLTARDEKESIVAVLNSGADDYVTKPFDLGELVARSKALIRRGKGHGAPVLKIKDLEINTADRTVRRNSKPIVLSGMEYRVLEYLAHRSGAIISKTELLEHLYDFNWERFSNVIEVYISGLRRKLDDRNGDLIQTSRGQGYMLRN